MRIGFIHPSWPGSEGTGATHSATQIVNGLVDAGHEVTVYTPESLPEGSGPDTSASIEPLPENRIPHTNASLNRAVKQNLDVFDQYDVVNSYLSPLVPAMASIAERTSAATALTLNAYAGVCAKNDLLYRGRVHCSDNSPGKCVECVVHSSRGHGPGHWSKRTVGRLGNLGLVRAGLSKVDSIDSFRAPSGHVRDNYAELGFPGEKIRVIPHPLDDKFLVEHRSNFAEPISLLYVGYLERQKGVDKLVPILAGLRDNGFDISLTVVGDGTERSTLERQASREGVDRHVEFRGQIPNDDLPAVYASHDVFVHPGVWEEPLARVYIEALATGTPIVTTQYGDVETIIGDGGVTTDGSVAGFVDCISSLFEQGQLRKLSEGANKTVDRYRTERIIPQVKELYQSVT